MMMTMGSPSAEQPAPMTVLEQHLAVSSDRCPMCDYNLHKLRGNTCPECGHGLELRVAVSNPRTGLLGLAAGAGFAMLVLLWGVTMVLTSGGPSLGDLIVLLVEATVLGALALVWIRNSGRIRRLPAAYRWPLAISTWLLSIGALVLFLYAIGEL